MQNQQAIDERLALIKQRFIKRICDWLPDLQSFRLKILDGEPSIDEYKDIRMQTHKISGSATTFGFPKLSECAAAVEVQLDRLIDNPDLNPDHGTLIIKLDIFVEEIKRSSVTDAA